MQTILMDAEKPQKTEFQQNCEYVRRKFISPLIHYGSGGIVAGILSWMHWHSVGWAIIATIFNWLYVIYYAFNYFHDQVR